MASKMKNDRKHPPAQKSASGLLRITFERVQPDGSGHETEADEVGESPDRIKELERELSYTKASHQGTIELETANEELKSTNQEFETGRRRTYDLYVEPNRDGEGKVSGLSCIAVDITFPP